MMVIQIAVEIFDSLSKVSTAMCTIILMSRRIITGLVKGIDMNRVLLFDIVDGLESTGALALAVLAPRISNVTYASATPIQKRSMPQGQGSPISNRDNTNDKYYNGV